MIMSAVLAVALNAVPVKAERSPQSFRAAAQDMSELVQSYRQSLDRRGTTHIKGVDRKGRPFEISVSRQGQVQGSVGAWDVSFHASDAS
jgi:hypothetical protein